MKNLVKRSNRYALSVSMTTREPRPGEVDGVSYFFVSKEEFDRTAQEDGFLEHASYVGHSYGTPKAWVLEQMKKGRDVILEIDAQGAKQIKRIMPDAVLVFVVTPDAECLLKRLRGRGTECRDVIARRIGQAATEVEEIAGYDYLEVEEIAGYDYLLVNDDLEQCTDDLEDIIRASHFNPHHNMELVENLKKGLHEILQRSQNSQ